MRKLFDSQKGAALVEFAIVLPLLIVLLFGVIEFGLLMYNKQIITNASREGARAGIVARQTRVDTATIASIVQNFCGTSLITFGAQNTPGVKVTGYSANAAFGGDLQVDVTYEYSFLLIPNFVPGVSKLLNIQATTIMRYE